MTFSSHEIRFITASAFGGLPKLWFQCVVTFTHLHVHKTTIHECVCTGQQCSDVLSIFQETYLPHISPFEELLALQFSGALNFSFLPHDACIVYSTGRCLCAYHLVMTDIWRDTDSYLFSCSLLLEHRTKEQGRGAYIFLGIS